MKSVEAMQVIQLLERCQALGADVASLRERADVSPRQLEDPDERLRWSVLPRILTAGEAELGDRLIGVRAGVVRAPRGLLVYQFRARESLKDALVQFTNAVGLAADQVRAELRDEAGETVLCLAVDDVEDDALAVTREYVVGFMVRFLADALGSFRPVRVRFPHAARGPVAEYERVLGAPVRFRQGDCAIVIPPELLAASLPAANPIVARAVDDQVERRQAALAGRAFCTSVERAIEDLVAASRKAERAAVARRLGVSVRTLQRRLGEEGATFRAAREAVLLRIATPLLAQRGLSLAAIAQRLGFADEDAFSKAWKRWTGRPPRESRRQGGVAPRP